MKYSLKSMAIGTAMSLTVLAALPALAQGTGSPRFDLQAFTKASNAKEPAGLRAAAKSGLRSFIAELTKDLKDGTLPDGFPFDINDISELHGAKLGMGFEVHTAHPQTLISGGRPLDQMLMSTGIWNFVVLVDDHPVALLELEKSNGKWQVNGVGGAKLAQDVHTASQNHTGANAFRFVRIFQATSDLMEVSGNDGKPRYVPLIAARQSLRMAAASADTTLPTGADVLPAIQDAVRNHLARFGR